MSRGSFFAFIDTSASYLDERWEIGGKGEEYEVSQLTGKRAIRVCSKRFCCAYLPRHIYKVSHLCSGYRWLNSCINFSFENLPGIPIVFKSVIVTLYLSLGLRRSEGHGDYTSWAGEGKTELPAVFQAFLQCGKKVRRVAGVNKFRNLPRGTRL